MLLICSRLSTMNNRVESRVGILLAIIVIGPVHVCSVVIIIASNISLTAVVNERVLLPCTPRVPDVVRWCFYHTPESECDEVVFKGLIVGDHSERYELQGNNLTVKSFADDLSGVYACVEKNGHGDMHRVNLTAKTLTTIGEPVTAFSNPTSAYNSSLSEYSSLHNATGETDEEHSIAAVIIGVIAGGFLSSVVVLLVTFAVLDFKYDIFKRHKRAETQNKKSDEASSLLDADLKEKTKTLFEEAKKYPETRDPWIMDQLHECGYMTECAKWVVNSLDRKPNAVVGIQGLSNAGSLLASRVAELLSVRYISLRISDPQTQGNQAAANCETSSIPDHRGLTAHLELRPERDNDIRQVIIVDMEIITGRNMKAAVAEVERQNLHVIKRIVINDGRSCTPGADNVEALVHSQWHSDNNND